MTGSETTGAEMPAETAIAVQGISKCYRLYDRPGHRLLETFFPHRPRHHPFWALGDVAFDVPTGTTMGIIGRNGSGKSTLLQIIAGTLAPTSGQVLVRGRVAALLELGAGFNGEFTGRENVWLNGTLMGLEAREIEERYQSIVAFADIGTFIDQPVKTYSSGMLVRLAFAVAVHVDPDVLIVDEALAVGDVLFQHKCMQRMRALMNSGRTVLFVSHDVSSIKMLCQQAVLLDQGRILDMGDADRIARVYHRLMFQHETTGTRATPAAAPIPLRPSPPAPANAGPGGLASAFRAAPEFLARTASTRFGDGRVRIVNVELRNLAGEAIFYVDFDQEVLLDVHVEFQAPVGRVVVGYLVRNHNGVDVIGTNTFAEGLVVEPGAPGTGLVLQSRFRVPLHGGGYTISPAVTEEQNLERADYLDWVDNALAFEVMRPRGRIVYAMFHVDQELRVTRTS